jgi:hypothetical protein
MKECSQCTNIDTPLCNECTFIESAKGNSTPTKYCGYAPESASDVQLEDLSALIASRAENRRPIQLNYVIKYNKLLEAKYNGTKENISTS